MKKVFICLLCAVSLGCAAHRSLSKRGTNYLIDSSCLTKPIVAKDCDLASPPKCKTMVVTMKPGCEQIDLGVKK